jgi:hypothetical protein
MLLKMSKMELAKQLERSSLAQRRELAVVVACP